MKKGFTLIELLAVIIILAVIMVIAVPLVLNVIDAAKKGAVESDAKLIIDAIEKKKATDDTFKFITITEENLEEKLGLKATNYADLSVENVSGKPSIIMVGQNKYDGYTAYGTYSNISVVDSDDYESEPVYVDYIETEGINRPKLATGMTAVKWNGSSWGTVTNPETDTTWYDYANKEWANAQTEDGSFWVWIPRYAYQIASGYHTSTAGPINVKFLKNVTNTASDDSVVETIPTYSGSSQTNFIVHPAFKFGNTDLTGIWVAKFETSAAEGSANGYLSDGTCPSSADNVTTKTIKSVPNVISWRCASIGNMFTVTRNMETKNIYGWSLSSGLNTDGTFTTDNNDLDTHIIKNMEWGAVTYLTYSTYGKNSRVWINPANNFTTGCAGDSDSSSPTTGCLRTYETENGVKASTTGNIYGIYDMSGGSWENVMVTYNNDASGSDLIPSTINDKYIDRYTSFDTPNFGDAVYETGDTTNGPTTWNGELYIDLSPSWPWSFRSIGFDDGGYAGLFSFLCDTNGGDISFLSWRIIIAVGEGL